MIAKTDIAIFRKGKVQGAEKYSQSDNQIVAAHFIAQKSADRFQKQGRSVWKPHKRGA